MFSKERPGRGNAGTPNKKTGLKAASLGGKGVGLSENSQPSGNEKPLLNQSKEKGKRLSKKTFVSAKRRTK